MCGCKIEEWYRRSSRLVGFNDSERHKLITEIQGCDLIRNENCSEVECIQCGMNVQCSLKKMQSEDDTMEL